MLLRGARRKMENDGSIMGDCFEASANYLLNLYWLKDEANWRLVHTMVLAPEHSPIAGTRFAHAFLLNIKYGVALDVANGKKVCLPKERYFNLGNIDPDSFPYEEYDVQQLLDKLQCHQTYGPWTDKDWNEAQEVTPLIK